MLDMDGIPEKSSELQDSMVLRLELLNVSDDRENEGDNSMWAGGASQDWFLMDE